MSNNNLSKLTKTYAVGVSSLPINIQGVTKFYGNIEVLKSVDLRINSGEFMTLLGPSGSGKTTLLMTLAGFIRPDSGSIMFGDEEIIHKPPHLRDVGMMFQNYALFPHKNVFSNIAYPLKLRGYSAADIQAKVADVLSMVQLSEYANRKISELSGGQRQRVALARAIVFKPKILLMDEPLSALDKNLRELMQVELRRMHEELGMTTVMVTHDQREALTMSDRIAVLRSGKITQVDTPEVIYSCPESEFVAAFMGESSFIPVTNEGDGYYFGGQKIDTDSITCRNSLRNIAVIRPEKLELMTSTSMVGYNYFKGVVQRVLFQGESCLGFVKLEQGNIIQFRRNIRESRKQDMPKPGDNIVLGLHRNETRIVTGE